MTDTLGKLQPVTDLQLPDTTELINSKAAFLEALKTLGVVSVQAEYNGSGDEGQIDTITAMTTDNTEVDLRKHKVAASGYDRPVTLDDLIGDFAWNAVQHFHSGFHNGEGGFGTLTIHVETGKVEISHDDNVIETVHSENAF